VRDLGEQTSSRTGGAVKREPTAERFHPVGEPAQPLALLVGAADALGLLLAGELPEAWIPPVHILELRTRVRLRKTLIDQRTAWLQRLQAQLFHQGVPPGLKPRTAAGRAALASVQLSPAGREAIELCLRMLDQLDREVAPIDRTLQRFARRQPGCRSLIEQLYGVGAVTATAILAELGDARRFKSSDDAVRHSGLDVTVWQSDRMRAAGHLSHQGPSLLRWALFEAAQCAARRSSPDHAYYLEVAKRIDHNRACLSVARKLCRRAHHLLRELGDDPLVPPDLPRAKLLDAAA
jgi:transposase